MTKQSEEKHMNAIHCVICKKKFLTKKDKCRDHNHLKQWDNYRSTICNRCNFTYASDRAQSKIYVILHNLSNYDAKLIFAALGNMKINMGKLSVIPKSTEKFLSFSIGCFTFIDSYQFLTSSLAILTENLRLKGTDEFYYLRKCFPSNYELLLSKQFYPYDDQNQLLESMKIFKK